MKFILRFIVGNWDNISRNKKRTYLALHFLKKYPTYDFFFFNIAPKESSAPKGTF